MAMFAVVGLLIMAMFVVIKAPIVFFMGKGYSSSSEQEETESQEAQPVHDVVGDSLPAYEEVCGKQGTEDEGDSLSGDTVV
ncbi:hypothetical protein P153DRAFT_370096 [Dothidotthia symphoricarpi CBS 119687]|uniref:Uncharacterized protein n=1 Tax=Dothidotthia symphoricarpi CBS 119687 TaxID=1392245 RepID=A0A6A6A2L2_9PLEO|nr:uncharacterized protein P153DRAFT_370096 [Dothidotthia symphoricarpi CBS 119687]KAF2125435.1 hypothetical protein P153DRAFT_370096 [Dothidotthia symphoricarpi CBS 119687]